MNKFWGLAVILVAFAFAGLAQAEEIDKNTAQMQAMDKITGRVSVINVPVGGEVKFGSLSIVVRSCKTRPVEETPDNFAFVDVADTTLQGEQVNIFKGWMISSSPATHAVEHPIYDVWLLKCYDTEIDEALLLDEERLAARDELPMMRDGKQVAAEELSVDEEQVNKPIEEMQAENEPQETAPDMSTVEFIYDEGDETAEDEEDSEITDGDGESEAVDTENAAEMSAE